MTDTIDALTLTLSRHFDAPPDRVWRAWLDPVRLAEFMSNCKGMGTAQAETDPRVGGRFRIVMTAEGREIPHEGTYLELIPTRLMRFTWQSPFSVDGSEVTITLAPEGTGTALTLTQRRFRDEAARDGHVKGWTAILDALATTPLER